MSRNCYKDANGTSTGRKKWHHVEQEQGSNCVALHLFIATRKHSDP